jgi:hypothetical protein
MLQFNGNGQSSYPFKCCWHRSGPCFNKYHSDKLAYKIRIRQGQREEAQSYTSDLHEALLKKEGIAFWKCWRSKLCPAKRKPIQVDGLTRDCDITNLFSSHLQNLCKINSVERNKKLQDSYENRRSSYNGMPFTNDLYFDAELVEKIVSKMKRGKAAGLGGLTAEHLVNCHPCLPTLLAKLFNLIIEIGEVPDNFGLSYTVPLVKRRNTSMYKTLTVNDFRAFPSAQYYQKCLKIAFY